LVTATTAVGEISAKVIIPVVINYKAKTTLLLDIMNKKYQVCTNCVMDSTDSKISFDELGICDHCLDFVNNVQPNWHTGDASRKQLSHLVEKIKLSGKDRDFDCIIGMSGGLDSSYMLHLAVKEFGLRPLVFHVDGGWNTDIAVNNIQVIVEKLGVDLFTEVINWQEMRDFQLAFFKAGVPHLDIPQDHAFIATLYHFANKHGIKYILNGGNISTECVRNPKEWLYYGTDMAQIRDIQRCFGTMKLETYPFSSIFFHKVYLRYIKRVQVVKPLNYLPYIREVAIQTLTEEYGWKAYPQKHFESRFTRFYEGYWLPTRFGFDTRRVQYSSLILTGQMTRQQALDRLKTSAYDQDTIDEDFDYIATKLGISTNELRNYHEMPKKSYKDYRNQEWLFDIGANVLKKLGIETSVKR
jgi:N-acetyl sugar amidotransferase